MDCGVAVGRSALTTWVVATASPSETLNSNQREQARASVPTRDLVRSAGAEVVGVASTVAEGLGLVSAVGFDAAILDANLAGETAAPIGRELRLRGAPFAVVSGYNRSQRLGPLADAPFVEKPFSAPTLLMAIRALAHQVQVKPASNG
mgnify:CR=1 FL=1